jgi:hypothetical protein
MCGQDLKRKSKCHWPTHPETRYISGGSTICGIWQRSEHLAVTKEDVTCRRCRSYLTKEAKDA